MCPRLDLFMTRRLCILLCIVCCACKLKREASLSSLFASAPVFLIFVKVLYKISNVMPSNTGRMSPLYFKLSNRLITHVVAICQSFYRDIW